MISKFDSWNAVPDRKVSAWEYSNTDLFYPNWEEIDASKNKSQEDSDDNYDYDNSNEINKLEDEHEINEEVFLKAYNESEEDSE